MQVGDLVWLVGSVTVDNEVGRVIGVIIGPWRDMPGWWSLMVRDEVVQWPENQLNLV